MEESFTLVASLLDNTVVRIVIVVIVLFVARFFIHRFIGQLMQRVVRGHQYSSAQEEEQRENTLISVFTTLATVILWILASIYILKELGVDLAALATGAGLLGIIIGFGAQNVIKDFLSGLFIILENQYRIGDVVTISGHSGVVEEITIRMTKLRDLEKNVYFVPNGEITTVKNMTLEYSGVVIDVGVSYDADIALVEKVINDVGMKLSHDAAWKKKIIEPISFLRVESFGDSSVNVRATGKVTPITQWDVAGEYRKRLKQAFDKQGIEIPFPQRVIHQTKTKS